MKRLKNNLLIVLSSANFIANADIYISVSPNQILIDDEEYLQASPEMKVELSGLMFINDFNKQKLSCGNKSFTLLTFFNDISKTMSINNLSTNCTNFSFSEDLLQLIERFKTKDLSIETLNADEELEKQLNEVTTQLNDLINTDIKTKEYILMLEKGGHLNKRFDSLLDHEIGFDFMFGGCYRTGTSYFKIPTRPQHVSELSKYNSNLLNLISQRKNIILKAIK